MIISGRKDAKSGNFVFHYQQETHTLTFKAIDQCVIRLADVVFPYDQDHVNHAIQTQMNPKDQLKYGKSIGWSLEDHGAYYIVKCLIDVPSAPYLTCIPGMYNEVARKYRYNNILPSSYKIICNE
jgi:hypothetical protein